MNISRFPKNFVFFRAMFSLLLGAGLDRMPWHKEDQPAAIPHYQPSK